MQALSKPCTEYMVSKLLLDHGKENKLETGEVWLLIMMEVELDR